MKHSFALWATLFGVTAAAAQVTTQLGTTTILPDLTVERSLQVGSPNANVNLTPFGTTSGTFMSQGGNSLLGVTVNNLPSNTNALPVGVTGYGKVNSGSNGDQAFGLYGQGELAATGGGVGVAGELTCLNNSGNAPDTNLPPNEAIGTGTSVCNGLQVTAGGGNNSSVGLQISSQGGSTKVYNTAAFLQAFAQYGLFIGAQSSGNQTSAVIQNNGTGINLSLGTTTAIQGNNTVVTALDANGNSHFNVRQNGNIYSGFGGTSGTSGLLTLNGSTSGNAALATGATGGHSSLSASSVPTANSCAGFALGTGSSDTSGRVTYTSAVSCSITFGTAFANNPFCVVSPGTAASTVEAAVSTSGLAVTFGTAQTAFQYICLGT